jgi:hypothetical protein
MIKCLCGDSRLNDLSACCGCESVNTLTRDGVHVRWRNWRRSQAFWMSSMSSQSAGLIIFLRRSGVRYYLGGMRVTDQPPAAIILILNGTRPHPIRRVYHPDDHCEYLRCPFGITNAPVGF